MAGSLQKKNSSSVKKKTRADALRRLIEKGWTRDMIVKKLSKGDERRAAVIRNQLNRIIATDEKIIELIQQQTTGELVGVLPDVGKGVGRRAKTGRAQEAKLVFEASGFHNPKSEVQHSGEVVVKLDIPRPPVVQDEEPKQLDEGIVDAEVVE